MKDILLLHGALGAKVQFAALKQLLSEKYNAHTFSFIGHSDREIPEKAFSIEIFARDIISYLEKNNIDEIDIFGYSMGGYAALYAALKNPGRIKKIFTLATKFEWTPEIAEREVKMLDTEKIRQKVPKFAEELANRHGADKWETVLVKTAEMMRELGNKNVLNAESLNQINNEVLIGIGDRDKMVSLEETIAAYRNLPNANLLVLPATPHPLEQVNPQRLVHEIESFF